jgi:hypothetical protein
MPNFLKSVRLCAVCLIGLAHCPPLAAQSSVDQQAAGGIANIYNLDRDARVGGVEIRPIDKAVASQAIPASRCWRSGGRSEQCIPHATCS